MKTTLDNFDSVTGWTASTGASVETPNEVKEYIAGSGITKSLLFEFDALDSYVEKTYSAPVDISSYTEVVFWIWSQSKRSDDYRTSEDFSYKISFGTSKDFYIPAPGYFGPVVIATSSIGTTIEKIRLTALHGDTDYVILSYGLLVKDNLPLDLFIGIKEKIEEEVSALSLNSSFLIGTIASLTAGASSITFTAQAPWIDRYVSIVITDGVNREYHQISERNNASFKFGSILDGSTLKYSYLSGASVYVYFPVVYGRRQTEIIVPSITLWGIEPEVEHYGHALENITDSFKTDDTFQERREGFYYKYIILIDCEARQDELLAELTNVVRRTIGKKSVYVLGRSVDIVFSGAPREVEPTEAFNIIPKVQYFVEITIKEEVYSRQSLPSTETVDVSVDIE